MQYKRGRNRGNHLPVVESENYTAQYSSTMTSCMYHNASGGKRRSTVLRYFTGVSYSEEILYDYTTVVTQRQSGTELN